MPTIPIDKQILRKWLKAEYIASGSFHEINPEHSRGIISPVLANMALDGMKKVLRTTFGETGPDKAGKTK